MVPFGGFVGGGSRHPSQVGQVEVTHGRSVPSLGVVASGFSWLDLEPDAVVIAVLPVVVSGEVATVDEVTDAFEL